MTHKRAPISTKLGFVGLGKYGYAVLRGTLGAGHHNLADIFVERLDRPTYSDNPDKLTELVANFAELTAQWRRLAGISVDKVHSPDIQYEDIGGLIQKVAGAPGDLGVLLLSLNRTRGEAVLREIARDKDWIRGTLWLFSSISRLATDEIRSKVGSANVRVLRYLPNRATGEGAGIIATYAPPEELADARTLVNDVFHGLGVIRFLENESDIDAARIVFGASLGMVAWFAQALAFSIQQAKGLVQNQTDAANIVRDLLKGAVEISCLQERERDSWKEVLDQIAHPPGLDRKPGTTRFLIEHVSKEIELPLGQASTTDAFTCVMADAYKECFVAYERGELEE